MPHATVNGTNLYYHESGHGLPVVLVHGFPLDHHIWHKQVHDLAPVCRVITPDLRGFGQSTGGGSFTIASLAEDLYVLLSHIHALPCVLGGLSMGGYVALAYEQAIRRDAPRADAHRHPRLRGQPRGPRRTRCDDRGGQNAGLRRHRGQDAAQNARRRECGPLRRRSLRELKSIMEACPAQTIQHCAGRNARSDRLSTHASRGSPPPTLIIAGEMDVLVPPAQSQEMHKAIRGSTISIIPAPGTWRRWSSHNRSAVPSGIF